MLTKEEKINNCIKCSLCCKYIVIPTLNPYTYEACQYYHARGFNTIEENGKITLYIYLPCPHLSVYGCNIYNHRPDICQISDGIDDNGDCEVKTTINNLIKEKL